MYRMTPARKRGRPGQSSAMSGRVRPRSFTDRFSTRQSLTPTGRSSHTNNGMGKPAWPSHAVPSFEDPLLAGFRLQAQPRLLVLASLDPARLPVDAVDVDDWQAGHFAKHAREAALAGSRLADDHDPLHRGAYIRPIARRLLRPCA